MSGNMMEIRINRLENPPLLFNRELAKGSNQYELFNNEFNRFISNTNKINTRSEFADIHNRFILR
jgi:hypothetical protein